MLLVAGALAGLVLFHGVVMGQDQEETRRNIKGQLEFISNGFQNSRHRMTARWGVIEGNIQRGHWAWACNSDGRRAERIAEANCQKNGGGCERLYSIYLHNDTPHRIRIYLFHPWESDFSTSNALFSWTWEPGEGYNLALSSAGRLLVSKRFYIRAERANETSFGWGPKTISEFNYAVRNYSDGQSLRIRLTP